MNLTSRVDIAELSDADLENISGGMAGGGSASLAGGLSTGLVEPLTAELCGSLQGTLSPEGGAVSGSAGVHPTSL
ncbi:hypothetical protein ACF1G5_07305 [Streptomyces coeruleorubidus]|jgi:hypothetical protein|uniref:hypothetical protein n=1 Tax=Streptomyces coeruleorubidus TaxID=116188 RepID=UPI0036F6DDC5